MEDPAFKVTTKAQEKIMKAIVIVKEKLSAYGADTVEISVDDILNDGEDDSQYSLTVAELNEVLEDSVFMAELEDMCRTYFEKLKGAGVVEHPEIVIFGGTARIPLIKTMLTKLQNEYFVQGNLNMTMNMDEFAAFGAVYAAADGRNIIYFSDMRQGIICDLLKHFAKLKAASLT